MVRDRDETETFGNYVSRPSRDRDVETETTSLVSSSCMYNRIFCSSLYLLVSIQTCLLLYVIQLHFLVYRLSYITHLPPLLPIHGLIAYHYNMTIYAIFCCVLCKLFTKRRKCSDKFSRPKPSMKLLQRDLHVLVGGVELGTETNKQTV